jgi:hypothetical protein
LVVCLELEEETIVNIPAITKAQNIKVTLRIILLYQSKKHFLQSAYAWLAITDVVWNYFMLNDATDTRQGTGVILLY